MGRRLRENPFIRRVPEKVYARPMRPYRECAFSLTRKDVYAAAIGGKLRRRLINAPSIY